jgi:glycosyltransferase involved in cell wall biosynthesis
VNQFYPPDFAATGKFISDLAKGLAERGHRVSVITSLPAYAFRTGAAPRVEQTGNLTIHRSRASKIGMQRIRGKLFGGIIFLARTLIKLRKSSLRGDLLLLTTAPGFLSLLGLFYKAFCNQKYSCLLYDLYPDVPIELGVIGPKNPIARLWHGLNRMVWTHAESLIVLTDEMKDRVVKFDASLRRKTFVVHNWADTNALRPTKKSSCTFARAHGYEEKFVVQYSGNLGRAHDYETILDAIRTLKEEKQIRFSFVGDGFGMAALKAIVHSEELPNCDFHAYQPEECLSDSLSSCDISLVSLLPSMIGVVAPSKLYGILAVGKPVLAICPPESYLAKVIRHEGCGVHVDNGDKNLGTIILGLSRNPSRIEAMGRVSRQLAETRFSLEAAISAYSVGLGIDTPSIAKSSLASAKILIKSTADRIPEQAVS